MSDGPQRRPVILGVAGGSGSGKTSVVRAIIEDLGEHSVTRIQHDAYYRDLRHLAPEDRARLNFDHPDALETERLVTDLERIRDGHAVHIPVYDYANHTRTDQTVVAQANPVIIVEGILVLAEPQLRELMDIRVFVDTDADLRILRRLTRDMEQRGRSLGSVMAQYLGTVRPMHLEFVEPSKRHAHVIIPEGVQNRVALDMLITKVRDIVNGGHPPA